jgi:hypothetical protein
MKKNILFSGNFSPEHSLSIYRSQKSFFFILSHEKEHSFQRKFLFGMLFCFRTESSFQREKTITGKKYNFILRSKKISQKK